MTRKEIVELLNRKDFKPRLIEAEKAGQCHWCGKPTARRDRILSGDGLSIHFACAFDAASNGDGDEADAS